MSAAVATTSAIVVALEQTVALAAKLAVVALTLAPSAPTLALGRGEQIDALIQSLNE